MAKPREPAVGFIFVTLCLMMMGAGIIIPLLPQLVTTFEGGDVAQGSRYYGLLMSCFAAAQFVAAPILGSLSDRFGRRRVLLIALAGSAIDYVIMGLAPSMGWLFVARLISGATAGALATCNAYIADVTPPERRAQAFGFIGAAFGLGFAVGPLIGGYLGQENFRLPFFVAAGLVGANWLYGALLLPESLPAGHRRPFSWRRANPVGSLLTLRSFRGVFDMALMYFIYMLAQMLLQSVWILYMQNEFGWTSFQLGLSLAVVGIATAVVQGGFVKRIIAATGERRGLILGLAVSAAAFSGYGLVPRGWMVYAVILVGCWGGIAGPASQAIITRHVPPSEQGGVQGSLSGLSSLAFILGPLIGAWSFGYCVGPSAVIQLHGIAFYEGSALLLVAIALAMRSFRIDDRHVPAAAAASQGVAETA
ncbi:MAG TPA: TCR/Tet family MFS transporter [Opitutaceae bacterium]|jgi:DHA1 family tetracycline resistance protein-like MFS transporter